MAATPIAEPAPQPDTVFHRLRRETRGFFSYLLDQYGTVLFIVGFVVAIASFALSLQLRGLNGDVALVKLAQRQSLLVQRAVHLASEMADTEEHAARVELRSHLIDALTLFENAHTALRQGDRVMRHGDRTIFRSGRLSAEQRELYYEAPYALDEAARRFIKAVRNGPLAHGERDLGPENPHYAYFKSDQPDRLIEGLDRAALLLQRGSEYKLDWVHLQLFLSFAFTALSLAGVGNFLLRPLVVRLKSSLAALQSQRDFNETVINTELALIVGLGQDGRIVLFNRYAQELTGWDQAEVLGADFFELLLPQAQRQAMRNAFHALFARGGGIEEQMESQLLLRSHERIDILWNNTLIRDPNAPEATLLLATGSDITQRKLDERRLQQAKDELAALTARMQEEINLAAYLQNAMLPAAEIEQPGIRGAARLVTSSEVGGDYYDYYTLGGFQTVLLVGDVSGHGVAAGTLVSAVKAGVHGLRHDGIGKPGEILRVLNETLLEAAHSRMSMTMAALSLDARNGRLRFANAGHVLPYLRGKDGFQWRQIETHGLPLGLDADSDYAAVEIELDLEIGDRLFLFTDGLVEEDSPLGEPFGYERLEAVLELYGDQEPSALIDAILTAVRRHSGRDTFTDDLTVVVIDHSEQVEVSISAIDATDVVRISEPVYRGNGGAPMLHLPRQYAVLQTEGDYVDLLPRLARDGIRRVLPRRDPLLRRLGWERLQLQHRSGPDGDLHNLMGRCNHRQFQLTHSDDKLFLMEETRAWLQEQGECAPDHVDALLVVLDEMVENSVYGAPRDGKNRAFFRKGTPRALEPNEDVRIDLALGKDLLGLMVTDTWGTLTPAVFLERLSHMLEDGMDPGRGGAGLYVIWRFSDYFQIRVHPHHRTQVTALWDLTKPFGAELDTGFQFFYHNEQDEVATHEDRQFAVH